MESARMLDDYADRFPSQGSFELRKGERVVSRAGGVPEEPGVYLIYGLRKGAKELLYVGKAGTLQNNGTFKDQKLRGRLSAKQRGVLRQRFFQEQIEVLNLDALEFRWFVTFHGSARVIPAKAEADLLQAYFDEKSVLPRWNEAV